MSHHHACPFPPGAAGRRLVKKNLYLVAPHPAKNLQQLDQALLIIRAAQAEPADFGNQVVAIHQVIHALIVPHEAGISLAKPGG